MNRTTSLAAVLAILTAGPLAAQTTLETDDEAEVIVIEPETEAVDPEVETVEPEVQVVDPEVAVVETEMAGMDMAGLITSDDIIDGPVYSTGEAYDEERWLATEGVGYQEGYGFDDRYENIGEIEELVFDATGQLVGVVAEVGGFLGIGDHEVMLPLQDVRMVPVGGDGLAEDRQFAYVTRMTEDQLEELPRFDDDLLDD